MIALGVFCRRKKFMERTGVDNVKTVMVTAPMTAMILLAVGYDLSFERSLLQECLKTVTLRFATQGAVFAVTALALKQFVTDDRIILFAVALCMFSCPPFSAQSMIRKERQAAYAGTTISLSLVLTIAVFAICGCLY